MKMNKSKLIGGIICLAAGGLFAVLTVTLPPDRMMFMIGDANVPIVPAIVLMVVGLGLLATAREGAIETGTGAITVNVPEKTPRVQTAEKQALNKRLEAIGWGLFLIMLGGFSLVPHEQVPKGVWSIGIGVIMLGLNATRYFYGIRMSGFTTFLGIISLVTGIAQLLGFAALEGGLFLIILGAYLLLKPWFDKRQIFGKAEESKG